MYNQQPQVKPPLKPKATPTPDDDREIGLDEWDDIVADRYKVPRSLMKSVRMQESGGNVNATSPTGVKGRYQVTEATARQYGLDRNDPWQQSVAAAKHLRSQYEALTDVRDEDEKWLGAVGRYYGGGGAVKNGELSGSSLDGVSNPTEHVRRVAEKWGQYRREESQGLTPKAAVGQTYPTVTPKFQPPVDMRLNAPSEAQKAFDRAAAATGQQPVAPKPRNVFQVPQRKPMLERVMAQQAIERQQPQTVETDPQRLGQLRDATQRQLVEQRQERVRRTREMQGGLDPLGRVASRALAAYGGAKPDEIAEAMPPVDAVENVGANLTGSVIRGVASLPEGVLRQVDNYFNREQLRTAELMEALANKEGRSPESREAYRQQAKAAIEGQSRLGDYLEPLTKAGQRVAQSLVPTDPNVQASYNPLNRGFWEASLPQAVGSTLPMLAGGAAIKAVGLPSAVSRLAAGGVSAGMGTPEAYHEAREKGATPEQLSRTVDIAAAASIPEMFGARSLRGDIAKRAGQTLPRHIAGESLKEGGTEVLQSGTSDLGDKYYARTKPNLTARQMLDNALMAGIPGAMLGMGGGTLAIPQVLNERRVAQEILAQQQGTRQVIDARSAANAAAIARAVANRQVSVQPQPVTERPIPAEAPAAAAQAAPTLPLLPDAGAQAVGLPDRADFPEGAAGDLLHFAQLRNAKKSQKVKESPESGLNNRIQAAEALLQSRDESDQEQGEKMLRGVLAALQTSQAYRSELAAAQREQPAGALPYTQVKAAIQGQLKQREYAREAVIERQKTEAQAIKDAGKARQQEIRNVETEARRDIAAAKEEERAQQQSDRAAQKRENYINAAVDRRRVPPVGAIQRIFRADAATATEFQQEIGYRIEAARAEAPTSELPARMPRAQPPRQTFGEGYETAIAQYNAGDQRVARSLESSRPGRLQDARDAIKGQIEALKAARANVSRRTPEGVQEHMRLGRLIASAERKISQVNMQMREAQRQRVRPTAAFPATAPLFRPEVRVNPEGGTPQIPEPTFTDQLNRGIRRDEAKRGKAKQAKRLISRITELGGIDERHAGEMQDAKDARRVGLIRKNAKHSPDILARQLQSEGYDVDPDDLNTLWQAIDRDIARQERPANTAEINRKLAEEEAAWNEQQEARGVSENFDEIVADVDGDTAALQRAIARSEKENPRPTGEVTRPGQPQGVSFSPYADMVERNSEAVDRLFEVGPETAEGRGIVGGLREFAEKNGIERRHIGNLLNAVRNHQMDKAFWQDQGLSLETVQQSIDGLDADMDSTRRQIAKLPGNVRTEVEREVAALDALFDDADAVSLLERAANGEDNAINEFRNRADEYGLSGETVRDLIEARRPSEGVNQGRARQNAQSQGSARNTPTRTEPRSPTPEEFDILIRNPATIPTDEFDDHVRAVEALRNNEIRGIVKLSRDNKRALIQQSKNTNEERKFRVQRKDLPAKFEPRVIPVGKEELGRAVKESETSKPPESYAEEMKRRADEQYAGWKGREKKPEAAPIKTGDAVTWQRGDKVEWDARGIKRKGTVSSVKNGNAVIDVGMDMTDTVPVGKLTKLPRIAERRGATAAPFTGRYTVNDLADNATAEYRPARNRPGAVYLNDWGHALIGDTLVQVYGERLAGVSSDFTLDATAARNIAESLRDRASGKFAPIAKALETAADDADANGRDIAIVTHRPGQAISRTKVNVRHETTHAAQSAIDRMITGAATESWLSRQPKAKQIKEELTMRGYSDSTHGFEAVAFVASGEYDIFSLTLNEATGLLDSYYRAIVRKYGASALEKFGAIDPKLQPTLEEAKDEAGTRRTNTKGKTENTGRSDRREGISARREEANDRGSSERAPQERKERAAELPGKRASFGALANEPTGEVLGVGLGGLQKMLGRKVETPEAVPSDWDVDKFIDKISKQILPLKAKDGTMKPPALKLTDDQAKEIMAGIKRMMAGAENEDFVEIFKAREDVRKAMFPELKRDVKWFDHLQSRLSNVNFRGTYERIAGKEGREISEIFRNAQVDAANNKITRGQAVAGLRKELRPYIQRLKLGGKPGLARWVETHIDAISDPDASFKGLAGFLKSFQYNTKLRLNPRSALVNSLQPLQTLWPHLTTREYNKVWLDALKKENRDRVVEIARRESGGGTENVNDEKRWLEWLDLFSPVSVHNRVVGHLAGEMLADKKGLTGDAKARMAADWAKKVEFDNSVYDIPPLFSGKIAGVVGQFKPFMVKNLERIYADWKSAPEEAIATNRWKGAGSIARRSKMVVAQLAIGGVRSAAPGIKMIGGVLLLGALAKGLSKVGMDDDDAEKMAEAIYFGAPGLLDQDLSGSVMIFDEPFGQTADEKIVNMLGPTISLAVKAWKEGGKIYSAEDTKESTKAEKREAAGLKLAKAVTPYTKTAIAAYAALKGKTPEMWMGKQVPMNVKEAVGYGLMGTPLRQSKFYAHKEAADWQKKLMPDRFPADAAESRKTRVTETGDVESSMPKRKKNEPEDIYKQRVERVEKWMDEYGQKLIDHPRYKSLSADDQSAAIESLRRRIGAQQNLARPKLAYLEPNAVLLSLQRSKASKSEREGKYLYTPQP